MLRRFLKEPLVHFLALALLIFIGYGALNKSTSVSPDRIVVTRATIEQIAGLFARTWRRPPSPAEIKGLVDDYVKEEIYYREALALGLDANDTVIRRRLRQKLEFFNDTVIEALSPTEAELEQYLQAHPAKFAVDSEFSVRQIFFNPEKRGEKVTEEIGSILEALRSDPSLDPASLGDTTLLPSELAAERQSSLGQTFGVEFAEAVAKAAPGTWFGPVKSAFGLHVVRVSEAKAGRVPPLSEVREAVAREWATEKRKVLADERFAELLKRSEIIIEGEPGTSPQALAGP